VHAGFSCLDEMVSRIGMQGMPYGTTRARVVRPDGTLPAYQPYGEEGLLIAEIDITAATGLLAARCRG
jgi:hypothetical protein